LTTYQSKIDGILAHLRGGGPHCRGCFALDALLGQGVIKTAVTRRLPWLGARPASVIVEQHPELGEYTYSPSVPHGWTHWRAMRDGHTFTVDGHGRRPTDEQLRLWYGIEARLPELIAAAIQAIGEPPIKPRRTKYSKDGIALCYVQLEEDGSFLLGFTSPVEDEIEMSPVVAFSGWSVAQAEWSC
jgi:hypothetical protein